LNLFKAMGSDHLAHEIVSRVENDPETECLSSLLAAADHLAELGLNRRAAALYQRVLDWKIDFPGAYLKFSQCRFPGANYLFSLEEIHRFKRPMTYLEIGVSKGRSFELARQSALWIGVDPNMSSLDRTGLGNARLFETTSDAFFEQHGKALFDGNRIDFAFIDGMHQFDFVLKDFINAERWMNRDGIIAVHDVIPVNRAGAGDDPSVRQWTGDVWKLTDILHRFRPDLGLRIISTGPTGLLLITSLDPDNQVLLETADKVQEFAATLDYGAGAVWELTPTITESGIVPALAEIAANAGG
jgi:hypothetical protein